jgi:hypothetical protein
MIVLTAMCCVFAAGFKLRWVPPLGLLNAKLCHASMRG